MAHSIRGAIVAAPRVAAGTAPDVRRLARPLSSRARTLMMAGGMALLIGYILLWAGLPSAERYQSDFTLPYANAVLLGSDHALLYSQTAEDEVARASGASPQAGVTSNWLPTSVATMVPLTALHLVPAMIVWEGLQLALLVAAVWLATRRAMPDWGRADRLAAAGLALAGIGTFQLLREGQWDAVPALGIAVAYAAWRCGRGSLAAAALAVTALWAKPQLALGLAAFLLGRWVWTEILAGALATVAILLVDLLIVGARLGAFLQAISSSAQVWPYSTMIGATGLTSNVVSGRRLELAVAIPLIAAALLSCLYLGRWSLGRVEGPGAALPVAVMLSLFATPHGYVQDLVVAAPAVIFLLAHAARHGRRPLWAMLGAWVLLNLTALFQANGGRASSLGPELVPVALLLLSFTGWVTVRHQPAAAAGPVTGRRLATAE